MNHDTLPKAIDLKQSVTFVLTVLTGSILFSGCSSDSEIDPGPDTVSPIIGLEVGVSGFEIVESTSQSPSLVVRLNRLVAVNHQTEIVVRALSSDSRDKGRTLQKVTGTQLGLNSVASEFTIPLNQEAILGLRTQGLSFELKTGDTLEKSFGDWSIEKMGAEHAMNALFTANLAYFEEAQIAELSSLRALGMNTLLISAWNQAEWDYIIAKIKSNETLQQFKYIAMVHSQMYDNALRCQFSSSCSMDGMAKSYLDHVIETVKQNQSLFVGYYTFDEPMKTQGSIPHEFQARVYDYIRARDRAALARPIIVSNTMWFASESEDPVALFSQALSKTAQDVVFVGQYGFDDLDSFYYHQLDWFYLWSISQKLVSFVPIMSAFEQSFCPDQYTAAFRLVEHDSILNQEVLPLYPNAQRLLSDGRAYFVYWPFEDSWTSNRIFETGNSLDYRRKPDFEFSIDNCPSLKMSTVIHLGQLR